MAKRNQINITLEDSEMHNIQEYCRVHGMTPQGLFKAGARRLVQEDILERKADLMMMQSLREIERGHSQPVDALLDMIEEDRRVGDKMAKDGSPRDEETP